MPPTPQVGTPTPGTGCTPFPQRTGTRGGVTSWGTISTHPPCIDHTPARLLSPDVLFFTHAKIRPPPPPGERTVTMTGMWGGSGAKMGSPGGLQQVPPAVSHPRDGTGAPPAQGTPVSVCVPPATPRGRKIGTAPGNKAIARQPLAQGPPPLRRTQDSVLSPQHRPPSCTRGGRGTG